LLSILFTAIISVGLLLCAFYLRSRPIATLNLCIWLIATFVLGPWSYLNQGETMDVEQQLAWDASLIWVVFFTISIIAFIYCLVCAFIAQRPPKEQQPPKRHRRRRSRRNAGKPDDLPPEDPAVPTYDI